MFAAAVLAAAAAAAAAAGTAPSPIGGMCNICLYTWASAAAAYCLFMF